MCAQWRLKTVCVVRMKKICLISNLKCDQLRFWSDRMNTQADLFLWLAHMSEGTFSDVVAHRFFITKTCLYNVYPLKPHFYIVKLGFTGVYVILLISAQKHRLLYSLEPPRLGGSNEYPQSMFWAEIWKKKSKFLSENLPFFLVVKFTVYLIGVFS